MEYDCFLLALRSSGTSDRRNENGSTLFLCALSMESGEEYLFRRMKSNYCFLLLASLLLVCCAKPSEIDDLQGQIDELKSVQIATIEQQIAGINGSLSSLEDTDKELKGYISSLQGTAVELQKSINATNEKIDKVETSLKVSIDAAKTDLLAQLQSLRTEMTGELATVNAALADLQAKDKSLEEKIDNLKKYVDEELKNSKDWVSATFATLEQYQGLVTDIAGIKGDIASVNASIADLETRLNGKIAADIASAVAGVNESIAKNVQGITSAYTSAIAKAKGEIESAYTQAIQTAITNSEASMQAWVNGRLTGYYTIAETDARIESLQSLLDGKIEAQKTYFSELLNGLKEEMTAKIEVNFGLITTLRGNLSNVETEISKHSSQIADNAEAVAANALLIRANADSIANNAADIVANRTRIADNNAAIAENARLIAANSEAIASLDLPLDAQRIAENTKSIGENAALIAANTAAISSNSEAIETNKANIANLRQELIDVKADLTTAYGEAIAEAIETSEGKMEAEITGKVSEINASIQSLSDRIDAEISSLKSRVTALENEVEKAKDKIAELASGLAELQEKVGKLIKRIQSITYIPKYSDGNIAVNNGNNGRTVGGDFEIRPHELLDELLETPSAISMQAVYTLSRSSSFVKLPVTSLSKKEDGVLTVEADFSGIDQEMINNGHFVSVALVIDNGTSSYVTSYTPVSPSDFTVEVTVTEPGTLKTLLTEGQQKTVVRLCVSGSLNEEDIRWIGHMSSVEYLNLQGTDMAELPQYAFACVDGYGSGLSKLKELILPDSCVDLNNALKNCYSLNRLIGRGIHTTNFPKGCHFSKMEIADCSGSGGLSSSLNPTVLIDTLVLYNYCFGSVGVGYNVEDESRMTNQIRIKGFSGQPKSQYISIPLFANEVIFEDGCVCPVGCVFDKSEKMVIPLNWEYLGYTGGVNCVTLSKRIIIPENAHLNRIIGRRYTDSIHGYDWGGEIECYLSMPPVIEYMNKDCTFYVPKKMLSKYKEAYNGLANVSVLSIE